MRPASLVHAVDDLPPPDDQQHHIGSFVGDPLTPPAGPGVALRLLVELLAHVFVRAAAGDAATDGRVIGEVHARRRRQIPHQRPRDGVTEHRHPHVTGRTRAWWRCDLHRHLGRDQRRGIDQRSRHRCLRSQLHRHDRHRHHRRGRRRGSSQRQHRHGDRPPLTDRLFDQPPGHRGDGESRRTAQREQLPARHPGALAVDQQEDRPVPEVDPVGDRAEAHQRPRRQQPRDGAVLIERDRRDDQHSGHRHHDQQAVPEFLGAAGGTVGGQHEHHQPERGQQPGRPTGPAGAQHRDPSGQTAPVLHHQRRGGGADEQRLYAGVGAEVDTVERCVRGQRDAGRRRGEHAGAGEDEHRRAERAGGQRRAATVGQRGETRDHGRHHQWPQQVVLLLDSQ